MSGSIPTMDPMELAQLSLPRIARAVAAGELRVDEAEAEMRRRPQEPRPRGRARNLPERPQPSPDFVAALAATRRELRDAVKLLGALSKRLEAIAELAEQPQSSRQRSFPTGPAVRRRAA